MLSFDYYSVRTNGVESPVLHVHLLGAIHAAHLASPQGSVIAHTARFFTSKGEYAYSISRVCLRFAEVQA